jgi:hypothetical protein
MSASDIESMISYKREAYDMKKVRCPFPCALALLIALQLWLPLFVPTYPAAYAETAPEQPFQEQIEREIRLGNARSFLYDLENSVACAVPSAENERIGAYVQSRYIDEKPSNTRYHMNEAAQLRFADPGAQVSEPAALWEEKGFEDVFSVSFVKFKPSRPRPWTCLPIISKTSLYRPGIRYDDSTKTYDKVLRSLKKVVASISGYIGMEPVTMTGNPNLASVLLLIDVQYSYYDSYGNQNIKGYSSNVILTALDAQTRKKIAAVTLTHELGAMITIQPDDIYEDNIYCASLQTITSEGKWGGFSDKLMAHERKKAASLFPMSPVTEGNAALFAAMLASDFADVESDPWRKAIYEKGVQDVQLEAGALRFRLCAFDPDLKAIGSYMGDPDAWLSCLHENISMFSLEVSVPLDATGRITNEHTDVLKRAVKKAAASSKKAFDSKDVLQALRDRYFPSPVEGKVKTADELLAVTPAFAHWVSAHVEQGLPALPPEEWSPFFYSLGKPKLDTRGGPLQLKLSYDEIEPMYIIYTPRKTATQVALNEHTPPSDFRALLLRHVAEYALNPPKDRIWTIKLVMDVESLTGEDLPDRYLEKVEWYASKLDEVLVEMESVISEQGE